MNGRRMITVGCHTATSYTLFAAMAIACGVPLVWIAVCLVVCLPGAIALADVLTERLTIRPKEPTR